MTKPRLSIELTQEQADKLKSLFPHGTKKIVFGLIVDDLLDILSTHGAGKVIGAFIHRQITLADLLSMREVKDGDDTRS